MAELLVRRRWTWALTGLFVAYGLVAVVTGVHLHDEGLLTFYFASWLGDAPAATLFFMKSRPLLSVLHAPFAALGHGAFSVAHVLVAASAIPLTAEVARTLGQQRPNVAGAIVASSPLLLASGAAGVSNSDGAAGAALCAWLYVCARKPLAAGALLGALLLARSELAVLAGVVVVMGRADPRVRRALLGAPIVPLLYVLAGTLYHGDVLWPLHYPPALPRGNPALGEEAIARWAGDLTGLASALLALSPAILLLPFVRARSLAREERAALAFVIVYVVLIRVLPLAAAFNFDDSPRYLLPALPFLAIVAGRAAESGAPSLHRARWLLAPAAVLASALSIPATRLTVSEPVDAVGRWLADHRGEVVDAPIVTNLQLLDAHLGSASRHRVLYLLQADQRHELRALTNADVGQTDALFEAMRSAFYGEPLVVADALLPDDASPGTIFVLREDERLEGVMPHEAWADRLDVIVEGDRFRIARLVP